MILLLACAGPDTTPVETAAPETAGPGTCANVASGFSTLTTWCTACHSATTPDRHGAPDGVDFDTVEGARAWSDRIVARAVEAQDMPFGGGIPDIERERLATWAACGMPGDEVPWPEVGAGSPPDVVSERQATVVEDGGDIVLVVSWDDVDRETLRFRKDGDQGFWVEEAYLDADGAPTWSRAFDPPLRVWADSDAWTETIRATRTEGGVEATTDETWTVTRALVSAPDARVRDQAATEVVLTSSAGETYTWLLSVNTSFSERRRVTTFEEDVSLGLTMPGAVTIEGFPVQAGQDWAERGYTRLGEGG